MSQEEERQEQKELPQDTRKSVLLRWILPIIGCIVSPAIAVFAILLFIKHWNEIRTLGWAGSGWLVIMVTIGLLCATFTVRAYTTTYGNMVQLAQHFFHTSQTPNDSSQPTSADSDMEPSQSQNPLNLRRQRIGGHCACIVSLAVFTYFLLVMIPKFISQLHNYHAFPSVPLIACTLIVSLLVQATIDIVVVEYHALQSTLKHLWKEWFTPTIERMPLFPTILIWEVLAIVAFSLLAYLWGDWVIWESIDDTKDISSLDIVKIALTTVGGLGAVGYIVIRYRDSQASKRAEERELSRMVDDKMQTAINQLGSEQASTRIAGVYALADIADTYRGNYCQRVVDILCGYLRSNRERLVKDETGQTHKDGSYDKAVESTIIDIIREHLKKNRPGKGKDQTIKQTLEDDQLWCECSLDLHGAHIHETFNFSETTIQTRINLHSATFSEGGVFIDAVIHNGSFFGVNLNTTIFDKATIVDTTFGNSTIETSFANATIVDTIFFPNTIIKNTSFKKATIKNTQFLSFTFLENIKSNLLTIEDSDFSESNIDNANFYRTKVQNLKFKDSIIKTINFKDIDNQGGITFTGAKFQSKDNDFGPIKLESNGLPKGAEWDIEL